MLFTWERITVDQVVSPNPARVGSIIVTPDDDDDRADVTLYDGESTSDPQLIKIRTGTGVTKVVNFQPYLQTHRGLYITLSNKAKDVLIQLRWDPE